MNGSSHGFDQRINLYLLFIVKERQSRACGIVLPDTPVDTSQRTDHLSTINSHTETSTGFFLYYFYNSYPMNNSFKKLFAGVSAAAIALTQVGTVLAAYSDVPAGVWYEEAVESFQDDGYLDASQTRFRGNDNANRAEFIKLVVELNGGILSTPPAVPSFDDVRPGAWYYSYMEEAAKEGWVKGDNNCYGSHPCYARPAANINRAEAAALIVRAFGLDATGDAPEFVDVPNGQWYTDAVQTAADHCVVQGDDTTGRARPADFMNRAEMVVMLHRVDQGLVYGVDCDNDDTTADPMISDVVATDASTIEVEFNVDISEDTMADQFMVSGASDIDVESISWINDSTVELGLSESLDAGEDYTLTAEDIETAGGDTFSDSMDFEGFTDRVVGEGTLEVSLSSSNPSGDTVPKGAVGVVFTSLDLTADCADDVWIDEITVLHEGFGAETDIDGLYLAMDGGRISRKRTLDSQDQTASLRLSDPLMVEACETITVDIVGDITTGATASAEHNFAVELPSDVQSNALDTEGTFPLRGNTFRIATVTSGTLTATYRTVSPDEVEVGDESVVIGKFELSTNSVEDQTIYSMTLEQNGTAGDGDYQNIHIARTDGTILTNAVVSSTGDFVTLTFDPPFTILEGDKITLEVLADITGGASDTLQMQFEEDSDIFAVGSLYGFGVNGQLYGSQVTRSGTADIVTIQAGELTIEIDGPTQQKFTRDDDDAILANFEIVTGGDSIDIRDFFVAIEGTTSTGAGLLTGGNTSTDAISEILEDVELRNTRTGQSVSAVRLTDSGTNGTGAADCDPTTTTGCTFQIYRFDDFEVDGSSTWELQVDFIDNGTTGNAHPKNGDKFRVHACVEPANSNTSSTDGCTFGGLLAETESYNLVAEGGSTGDDVTDVRPGATVSGNFQRIATPELNIAVKSIGTIDTAVKNSDNVNLLRFEARAGEAEDILFTQAIFTSGSGSLQNAQDYTLWFDSDGDGVVDTIAQAGESVQNSNVTFDDLTGGGVLLPAEESVLFEVHADIASSLTNDDLRIRFATGATNYIEAEEADNGSSLSNLSLNGTCATSPCEIVVTTVLSKHFSLVSQGDLFVSLDSTPSRSRQLLGGTLGDTILRLQFRAQNEDIDVTDLQISSSGSNASSIDRLELYKDGATTAFATATVSGCGSDDALIINPGNGNATIQTFCANMENGQLVVEDGENLDVIVKARMKSDEQGALSGQDIQLWLTGTAVSDNSTGSGAVRARGNESSGNLTANDADASNEGEVFIGVDSVTTNASIVGNISDVVLAKVTTIANANPDADNTNVPTGVSPFGQFRFTAATNSNTLNGLNKATLSGVIFNVNATNVAMDAADFKFYNKADSSTKATCRTLSTAGVVNTNVASGAFLVECRALKATSVDTALETGEVSTFVLEGDITNSDVVASSSSTLQVSIQDFTTRSTTTFGATVSHIDWVDEDAALVSASTTSSRFKWLEYSDTVVRSTSYKS